MVTFIITAPEFFKVTQTLETKYMLMIGIDQEIELLLSNVKAYLTVKGGCAYIHW